MKKGDRSGIKFVKQLYVRFTDDSISALSAQLAFYLLMSLFPFILFLLNLISFTPISSAEFSSNIAEFLPAEVAGFFSDVVGEIVGARSTGLLSIGALVALWSASRGISAISYGLNKAYDRDENRPFWKVALITMLFTVGIAVLVLAALLLLILGEVIAREVFSCIDGAEGFTRLWRVLRYVVPLILMFLVFTLLYKWIPNHRLRFRDVLPGAMFTIFGWIITSVAFSFYVNNFSRYTRIYGSIGGIIILLIWLYLSSMVVLLGGEINGTVLYFRSGTKIDKYENPQIKFAALFRGKRRNPPPR